MKRLFGAGGLALLLLYHCARAQVIEFMSNGLKYQALTRSSVTVMYAHLPTRLHEYAIVQVAVSNGSPGTYVIRPEDFSYLRSGDLGTVQAASAYTVIDMLMQKGNAADVIKLVTTYESGVYGNSHFRSTNGYEQRRQAALAFGGTKLKAATTASALAMVQTKLASGETTDGAVFFPNQGKPLAGGRLVVRTNTDVFEFNVE